MPVTVVREKVPAETGAAGGRSPKIRFVDYAQHGDATKGGS